MKTQSKILKGTRILMSLVIVFFLAAQAFTGLIYHPKYLGDSYFPFMDYPMFKAVKKIGSEIPFYHVVGILASGAEIEIKPEDLHLDYWKFEWGLIQELKNEHLKYKKIEEYTTLYDRLYHKKFSALRLEDRPRIYLGSKLGEGERKILRTAPLPNKETA